MSKGLEALERVKKFSVLLDSEKDIVKDLVEIIPNTLKTIEKELQALEIIKNKGVDILALQHYQNASQYNFSLRGKFSQLTEEEFNLLKDVLNNG